MKPQNHGKQHRNKIQRIFCTKVRRGPTCYLLSRLLLNLKSLGELPSDGIILAKMTCCPSESCSGTVLKPLPRTDNQLNLILDIEEGISILHDGIERRLIKGTIRLRKSCCSEGLYYARSKLQRHQATQAIEKQSKGLEIALKASAGARMWRNFCVARNSFTRSSPSLGEKTHPLLELHRSYFVHGICVCSSTHTELALMYTARPCSIVRSPRKPSF